MNNEDAEDDCFKNRSFKKIIAIPRSGSTLLELILGSSKSISKVIHEPFHNFAYYGLIPKTEVFSQINNTLINTSGATLLKDMSHWVLKEDAYKELFSEDDKKNNNLILLVKNPILTIESKIRKILQGISRKERSGLKEYLIKNNILSDFSIDGIEQILEEYAKKFNYSSWKEMLYIEAFDKRRYVLFQHLINFFIKETSDIWGWDSMGEIKKYLDDNKIKYSIIDSVDIQLFPKIIEKICLVNGLMFNEDMLTISAEKSKKIIDIGTLQPEGIFWYDEAFGNTEIKKPSLIVPEKEVFPNEIKTYLEDIALPLYKDLLSSENRITLLKEDMLDDFVLLKKYAESDIYYVNKELETNI